MLDFGRRPPSAATAPTIPAWAGVATSALPFADHAAVRQAPLRLPHHMLIVTTAGHGTVEIDFTVQPCRPGTLLWARPGQALRFGGQPGHDAILVMWERDVHPVEEFIGIDLDGPFGPARWQLASEDEDAIISEVVQLGVDCRRHRSGPVAAALLRHQLSVLLLRLALLKAADTTASRAPESPTFIRFRRELEQSHPDSRRVEDYAARLGCSVRTLTRASLAVTGRTAKQLVDDRVALEARRLLACTTLPIAEIGRHLGFPEPTNFGRFFHREVGCSPGTFRAALRGTVGRVPVPRRSPEPQ